VRGSGVEHERDGTVVDDLDRHPRTEDARLDADGERPQLLAEPFVERLGVLALLLSKVRLRAGVLLASLRRR
jgi:hypothetical protein